MARITVNTTGTQPQLYVSTTLIADKANWGAPTNTLAVGCLQDITITNSTGIYSYTDFCNTDTRKITTPSDNEITTNVVLDDKGWFGDEAATAGTAKNIGIAELSFTKKMVQFVLVMNGSLDDAGAFYYAGQGYISSLAPTVSPEAPVWISPLTIAVDGSMVTGKFA